jgi:hypothetical protein
VSWFIPLPREKHSNATCLPALARCRTRTQVLGIKRRGTPIGSIDHVSPVRFGMSGQDVPLLVLAGRDGDGSNTKELDLKPKWTSRELSARLVCRLGGPFPRSASREVRRQQAERAERSRRIRVSGFLREAHDIVAWLLSAVALDVVGLNPPAPQRRARIRGIYLKQVINRVIASLIRR